MAIQKFADNSQLDTETGIVTNAQGITDTPAQAQASFNINNPITADSLRNETPISLNPAPVDNNNYQGIINGGLENAANKPQIAEKSDIQSMLESLAPPPSGASLYESTYGVGPTQEELSVKKEIERKAQEDLDLLNAQMRSLNAEAKAVPIQVQQEATGRGITAGGVKPIETARLRDLALRSLPLEGQILAQQAILTGSQRALQLAQSKFDQVFQLRLQDIQNQYNYKKDQQNKVWNYLTTAEQNRLADIRQQDQNNFTLLQNSITNAQNIANKAMENGQADIASRISQLDPESENFLSDLGKLQGQIIVKQDSWSEPYKIGVDTYQKNTKTGEVKKIDDGEKGVSIEEQLKARDAGYTIDEKGNLITTGNINIPETSRLAYVNNNPGNLRFVNQEGATLGENGFARFNTPEEGYNALKKQIELDKSRGFTVEQFINKYAPPTENATSTYITQFNNALGTTNQSKINNINTDQIAQFMAKKESGTTVGETDSFDKFSQEQIALSAIPVQLRNTQKELDRFLTGIKQGMAQGLTPYQIADNLTGYKINQPDNFSNTIRTLMSQSPSINSSDPGDFARLINAGDRAGAVKKIETAMTKDIKDYKERETTARYTYEMAPKIYKEITNIENKFGIVAGNWEKQKKKVVASQEFQKVSSELASYIQEWRRNMIGTQATQVELDMIKELLPAVTDNPTNLKEKIKSFAEMQLNILNSNRGTVNLPKVNVNDSDNLNTTSLFDYNTRVNLYENNDDPLGIK